MHKSEHYSCIYWLAFFGISYYEIGLIIQIIWWDKNVAFILWYQSVSIQNQGVAYVPKKEMDWKQLKQGKMVCKTTGFPSISVQSLSFRISLNTVWYSK